MHISIANIEPNGNQKLTQSHCDTLVQHAQNYLDLEQGYQGHFYGLYLFTNGYDQSGNKINYHYKNYTTASANITKHYSVDKLTHAHIVLRFGTNSTHGADGQPGLLKAAATTLLSDITNDTQSYGFKDIYGGKEFTSHMTVAAIKSDVGKPNARWNSLNLNQVLTTYKQFHDDWKNNGQQAYTLNLFNLSGESMNPKRTITDLGLLEPRSQNVSVLPIKINLKSTGLAQAIITEADNTMKVTTDHNANASYQLESDRLPVVGGEKIHVPYEIIVEDGGIMSLGLLNTMRNGWYGEELILKAGHYSGAYERIVPEGETVASLVFRNYHLGTAGQSTFTIKEIGVVKK